MWMFGESSKESHDHIAKFEARELKGEYDKEVGKYVICSCKEAGSTRLFIQLFSEFMNYCQKAGWWNTFTVCKKPVDKVGNWICKIEKYDVDRNGYLKCTVKPIKYIGENVDFESRAWIYFSNPLFASMHNFSGLAGRRFNTIYLESTLLSEEDIEKGKGSPSFYTEIIFDKFLNDLVTIEQIDVLLDQKSELEFLAEELGRNPMQFAEKYPLTAARMCREVGVTYTCVPDVEHFLREKYYQYNDLKLGEVIGFLERAEAVAEYWHADKERKKAERKAKRKARQIAN